MARLYKLIVNLFFFTAPIQHIQAMTLLPGSNLITQWKNFALTKANGLIEIINQTKASTNKTLIEANNVKMQTEFNIFSMYAYAYLTGKQVADAFFCKTQLEIDMNDLGQKNITGYAPLQALNLSALVSENSDARKYVDYLNALASSITVSASNPTPQAVTSAMLENGQAYFLAVKKLFPTKLLLDTKATLEKIFSERAKALAGQYGTKFPDVIPIINKLCDDTIAKAAIVINTPANAPTDAKKIAKDTLVAAQQNRPSLKAALAKIIETITQADKTIMADIVAKTQAENTFAQESVKYAAQFKTFAPTEVGNIEKLAAIVAAGLGKVQAAQSVDAANAALNEAIAQRKPIQDWTAVAKSVSDKATIADALAKVTAENNFAQESLKYATQFKALAGPEVSNVEKLAAVVAGTLTKVQSAQTPEIALAALQEALAQRKSLQDWTAASKTAADKTAVNDAVVKIQAENSFAQDALSYATSYKTIAPTQVSLVEQLVKNVADNIVKAQNAATADIATSALNEAVAQRKPLQDTLVVIKSMADKWTLNDATTKVQAENTFALEAVKYVAPFKTLAPAEVAVVEKLAAQVAANLTKLQATDTPEVAASILSETVAQRKQIQDGMIAAKAKADAMVIADLVTKVQAENTAAQDTLKTGMQYKTNAPTEVAALEKIASLITANVTKVQTAQTPDIANATLTETIAQRKPLQDALAAAKIASDNAVITHALAKAQSENAFAQDILSKAAQYKTVAPAPVTAIEQSVKIVSDNLAKIQSTQAADIATTILNEILAQHKILEDSLALAKTTADKSTIANALTKVQAENTFAQGILTTATTLKPIVPAEVTPIEQLVKIVTDNLAKAQAAQDAITATNIVNETLAQHKPLEDALTAAQNAANKIKLKTTVTLIGTVDNDADFATYISAANWNAESNMIAAAGEARHKIYNFDGTKITTASPSTMYPVSGFGETIAFVWTSDYKHLAAVGGGYGDNYNAMTKIQLYTNTGVPEGFITDNRLLAMITAAWTPENYLITIGTDTANKPAIATYSLTTLQTNKPKATKQGASLGWAPLEILASVNPLFFDNDFTGYNTMSFNAKSGFIAVGGSTDKGWVKLLTCAGGIVKNESPLLLIPNFNKVNYVDWSTDGQYLVIYGIAASKPRVEIFSFNAQTKALTSVGGSNVTNTSYTRCAMLSSDNQCLVASIEGPTGVGFATFSFNGSSLAETGRNMYPTTAPSVSQIRELKWSPNGQYLFAGLRGQTMKRAIYKRAG